jgi:hypothetical protein
MNQWYKNVIKTADPETQFASARVGDFRVTIALAASGHYGLAICSPKDAFNRKKGQAIAYTRLTDGSEHFAGVFGDDQRSMPPQFMAVGASFVLAAKHPDRVPAAFAIATHSAMADVTEHLMQRPQRRDNC